LKRRIMAKRDAETRVLSRLLYREIAHRSDPEQDWWVSRDVVERELGMKPDALEAAAELLVEDAKVESGSSDHIHLRPA
jgi:hypothetical protein